MSSSRRIKYSKFFESSDESGRPFDILFVLLLALFRST